MKAPLRAAALAALLAGALAAPAHAATSTASSGDVSATLTIPDTTEDNVYFTVADSHLVIQRAGQTVYDGPLPRPCDECDVAVPVAAGPASDAPLLVGNLGGDASAEVLVAMSTGGAHCCTVTATFEVPASGTATSKVQDWGNGGYGLDDLDHDGVPEFVGRDERFFYEFTAYVFSGAPERIWSWRAGNRFAVVTKRFPAEIAGDAKLWFREYRKARGKRNSDVRGFLAAYLAEKALLGQARSARRELDKAVRHGWVGGVSGWPRGKAYARAVKRFLRKHGYPI